jgi:hypothetical protein
MITIIAYLKVTLAIKAIDATTIAIVTIKIEILNALL